MIRPLIASLLLTGCSATVKVHVPMQCLPMPEHHVVFTEQEKESITDSVLTKFELIVETYKARIRANIKTCELHNKLHVVEK